MNGFGVSCNGASDGYINIIVTGGTPPYEYEWSGQITLAASQNISNIGAGGLRNNSNW